MRYKSLVMELTFSVLLWSARPRRPGRLGQILLGRSLWSPPWLACRNVRALLGLLAGLLLVCFLYRSHLVLCSVLASVRDASHPTPGRPPPGGHTGKL